MHRALLPWVLISLVWAAEARQKEPDLLDRWSSAVTAHQAGEADEWAVAVGDWPKEQLVSTLNEVRRGGVPERLLRLGAILHFDIAFHASPRATGPLFRASYRSRAYRSTDSRVAETILAVDGRDEGRGTTDTHLEFARALLKELTPGTETQDFVRLWYDATAARLARLRNFAELLAHLQQARLTVPTDPEILFASGYLQEVFAAPRIQAVARIEPGGPIVPVVGSVAKNLSEAERFYRRVLQRLPGFAEARLRLGRVLGLQRKHREAVVELERAIEDAEDSTESYLAHLFLGREEEMLGRLDRARLQFERAAVLSPSAQSPQISLSRLAGERGDDRAAQEILNRILIRSDGDEPVDPWWSYEEGPGRHAERKLARLYWAATQEIR